MKRIVIFLFLISLLPVSYSHAQQKADGDRYVFVISKVNYLKAIQDAVSVSNENGLNVAEVRVILCGESVKDFQEEHPVIQQALADGRLALYACGLSLEQMQIDPETLPKKVSTVRNGILEAMILEKRGFSRFDL